MGSWMRHHLRVLLIGEPATADAGLMLRAYGWLYLAGATLCLLWLGLSDRPGVREGAILVCIGVAFAVSAVSLGWLHRRALPWMVDALVAIATVLISLVVVFDHTPASPLAWFYVWATAYAFWFFRLRRAMWQVLVAGLGYATALWWLGGPVGVDGGRFVMMMGTLLAVGALIRVLALRLQRTTQRFQLGFEDAAIGMCLSDADGRFLQVNGALCALLGRERSELAQMTTWDVTHADDIEVSRACVASAVTRRGGFELEQRYLHRDGRAIWTNTATSFLRDSAEMLFFTQVTDITERRQHERRLRLRARGQAAVAELGRQALEGVSLPDLAREALTSVAETLELVCAEVLDLSERGDHFEPLARVGPLVLGDEPVPATPDSHAGLALALERAVAVSDYLDDARFAAPPHGAAALRSGLVALIHVPDGIFGALAGYADERREFTAEDGDFMRSVANVLGAAIARRQSDDRIRHSALHDPMTGLPNRTLFLDRLGHALERTRRSHRAVGVLFLDLDTFKDVNDALGHHVGDALLVAVAERLTSTLRPTDTVARFGGDEFLVLCEDTVTREEVTTLAERLAAAIAQPIAVEGRELFVTASIGIVLSSGAQENTAADLLRDADAAMYSAKAGGRARIESFDLGLRKRLVDRTSIEQALHGAPGRGEMWLAYQPIVAIRTRQVVALEALVRWNHPVRGQMLPDAFVGAAEDCGQIVPLGAWVLGEACRQAARWNAEALAGRRIPINVNVSSRQLAHPGFAASVAEVLEQSGLEPDLLALEITERTLIAEADGLTGAVSAVRGLGVRFILDDFGTGYAPLSHLSAFPLDGLKLDRSFVASLDERSEVAAVIGSVLRLGHALGLDVVAEGVEKAEHETRLLALGCDVAQGYRYAVPLPLANARELLSGESMPRLRAVPSSR